ncbi:hypothetical protein UlMin_002050 [Ulmus minor]
MAEKFNQVNPLAPSNGHPRSDEEAANSQEKELKRQKRIKLAIYIAIFAVFQMIVIGVFGAVVMKAKTPKFRLSNDVQVKNLDTTNTVSSPSFNLSFTTQVRIKNPNFGPYKFDGTTAAFTYQGETVGEITILKGKAGMKSTKKIDVSVSLNSTQLANKVSLGAELSSGTLTLRSSGNMNGKVELMWIMKKKKSTNMNCTIVFDVQPQTLRSLECK